LLNVSYFSFLDRLARFVGMMRTVAPSNAFSADVIRYQKAKASRSDGGTSFSLSLCMSVKVSLMVM
jgi:hypothetical protein